MITDGYAVIRFEYDSEGRVVRTQYFGTDGKAAVLGDGYSETETSYADDGSPVTTYLDADGNVIKPEEE